MNKGFNPERLKDLRVFRGLSQLELSDELNITKQAVSQYENGIIVPKDNTIYELSNFLDVPISYFSKPYTEKILTPIFFRKRKTSQKKIIERFEVNIKWVVEIYSYLQNYLKMPEVKILRKSSYNYSQEEIIKIASELRRFWGLGNGPIDNLTLLLENNGFIISKTALDAKKVDACSVYFTSPVSENRPMIFLTSTTSAVRSRKDLGHELAHQILHSWMSIEDFEENKDFLEKEADFFANCFLMPPEAMEREIFAINTLDSLLYMKKRWGVSMQGIIYHLHDIGLMEEDDFERFKNNIYRRGWRTREPDDDKIKQEMPELVKDAMLTLTENNFKSAQEILEELRFDALDVLKICGLNNDFFDAATQKRAFMHIIR